MSRQVIRDPINNALHSMLLTLGHNDLFDWPSSQRVRGTFVGSRKLHSPHVSCIDPGCQEALCYAEKVVSGVTFCVDCGPFDVNLQLFRLHEQLPHIHAEHAGRFSARVGSR